MPRCAGEVSGSAQLAEGLNILGGLFASPFCLGMTGVCARGSMLRSGPVYSKSHDNELNQSPYRYYLYCSDSASKFCRQRKHDDQERG